LSKAKKVVVITGAASGLGLELAKSCLQRNMQVVIVDKAVSSLSDSNLISIICDVRDKNALKALAKQTLSHFGRIDWLINNAGVCGHLAPVWELTAEQIQTVMDTNVYGAIYGTQAFLPYMFQQTHQSHVINIASMFAFSSGSLISAYAMSKHALIAFSESLYFDLKRLKKPVNVSLVCPSFINTPFLSQANPLGKLQNKLNAFMTQAQDPKAVAEAIISAIEQGIFYILPDPSVALSAQERIQAIMEQNEPNRNKFQQIIDSLQRRMTLSEKV
jgi:NAD(P)-dependent dehydrogenase (short-subunit alcohol dehydrogenase family)